MSLFSLTVSVEEVTEAQSGDVTFKAVSDGAGSRRQVSPGMGSSFPLSVLPTLRTPHSELTLQVSKVRTHNGV